MSMTRDEAKALFHEAFTPVRDEIEERRDAYRRKLAFMALLGLVAFAIGVAVVASLTVRSMEDPSVRGTITGWSVVVAMLFGFGGFVFLVYGGLMYRQPMFSTPTEGWLWVGLATGTVGRIADGQFGFEDIADVVRVDAEGKAEPGRFEQQVTVTAGFVGGDGLIMLRMHSQLPPVDVGPRRQSGDSRDVATRQADAMAARNLRIATQGVDGPVGADVVADGERIAAIRDAGEGTRLRALLAAGYPEWHPLYLVRIVERV